MPRKPKAGVAAEVTLTLRMTDHDRTVLDRLVAMRAAELSEMGADEADVTAASYVRALIRREGKAKGVSVAVVASEGAGKATAAAPTPTSPQKAAAQSADEAEAAEAHAALVRALDKGELQSRIADRAGIDKGTLSKFKNGGRVLTRDNVQKLMRALS